MTGTVQVGQRVWIGDGDGCSVAGVIASVQDDFLSAGGFVALLDGHKTVVTCSEDQRGVRWDFVADYPSFLRPVAGASSRSTSATNISFGVVVSLVGSSARTRSPAQTAIVFRRRISATSARTSRVG